MAWSGRQRGRCMKALTGHAAWPLIRKADAASAPQTAIGRRRLSSWSKERCWPRSGGSVRLNAGTEDRFADVIDDVGARLFVRATSADQADSEVLPVSLTAA